MTSFYTIDAANERLGDVREMLLSLQSQREELIRLRDLLVSLEEPATTEQRRAERPSAPPAIAPEEEARLIRLRMQGMIDQMQASVAKIDGWGITLRDIGTGLIDFPALANGRQIWLCWRLGEGGIGWYHELNAGVAGRRQLAELV